MPMQSVSIKLPSHLLGEARRRAQAEDKSLSEIVRDALQQYMVAQRCAEISAEGDRLVNELERIYRHVLDRETDIRKVLHREAGPSKPARLTHSVFQDASNEVG